MEITVTMTEAELEALQTALGVAYSRGPKYMRPHFEAACAVTKRAAEQMEQAKCAEAAKPAEQRLAEAIFGTEHTKDSDCTVGEDNCCVVCGVEHGVPCSVCGGRGFHADDCERMQAQAEAGYDKLAGGYIGTEVK